MRNNNIFWGVALVLLGVLILTNALRYFWPIVLIVLGAWVLIQGRWGLGQKDKSISLDLQSARTARVRVNFGAGRLRIDGAASAGKLLEGTVNEEAQVESTLSGEHVDVRIRNDGMLLGFPGFRNGLRWDLHLAQDVPLTLDLETGACNSTLDLSAVRISMLNVNTGASQTDITLPANGHTTAEVHAGASEIRLRLPQGVAARIRSRSGLAEVRMDNARFPRVGDVNQSPDFDSAANRVDLLIEVGASSVRVL